MRSLIRFGKIATKTISQFIPYVLLKMQAHSMMCKTLTRLDLVFSEFLSRRREILSNDIDLRPSLVLEERKFLLMIKRTAEMVKMTKKVMILTSS